MTYLADPAGQLSLNQLRYHGLLPEPEPETEQHVEHVLERIRDHRGELDDAG